MPASCNPCCKYTRCGAEIILHQWCNIMCAGREPFVILEAAQCHCSPLVRAAMTSDDGRRNSKNEHNSMLVMSATLSGIVRCPVPDAVRQSHSTRLDVVHQEHCLVESDQ